MKKMLIWDVKCVIVLVLSLMPRNLGFMGVKNALQDNRQMFGNRLSLRMDGGKEEYNFDYEYGRKGPTKLKFDISTVNPLPQEVKRQLAPIIENMVTAMAIKTNGYYMSEFHDNTSKAWMLSYLGYEINGFPDDDWRKYIGGMIDLDEQVLRVLTNPTKAMRQGKIWQRATMSDPGAFMLQYTHNLEPRKIAHSILQVMEDVGKELVLDLYSIHYENREAERFATEWMHSGLEEAQKHRKRTHYVAHSSTPLRGRNYQQLSLLVTNVAIDLAKADLGKAGDKTSQAALVYLCKYVDEYVQGVDRLGSMERLIQEPHGPRTLIEKLYFRGLTESIVELEGEASVSVLNIAQLVLEKRMQTAATCVQIVGDLTAFSRHYYRQIRDKGGFKKFNMANDKPEFEVVKVDDKVAGILERGEEIVLPADYGKKVGAIACAAPAAETPVEGPEHDIAASIAAGSDNDVEDISVNAPDLDGFGSGGPTMM